MYLLYQYVKRLIKLAVIIIMQYYCYELHTKYVLSIILLWKLSPHVNEINLYYQCGVRHNRSSTEQIICIRKILEIKWEYNETVHQLFIDFKKAYYSVRRELLYNIYRVWGTHETSQVD
jgi:hypothetical protein